MFALCTTGRTAGPPSHRYGPIVCRVGLCSAVTLPDEDSARRTARKGLVCRVQRTRLKPPDPVHALGVNLDVRSCSFQRLDRSSVAGDLEKRGASGDKMSGTPSVAVAGRLNQEIGIDDALQRTVGEFGRGQQLFYCLVRKYAFGKRSLASRQSVIMPISPAFWVWATALGRTKLLDTAPHVLPVLG